MARFFIEPKQINGETAAIIGPDVKHLVKVLRMGLGDQLTLLDGTGKEYQAVIKNIEKDLVTCEVLASQEAATEPKLKVTLVQGLPKGDKMEYIIQKCTELGVHQIIPLAAERSVVKLDEKKAGERQERWQRVAMEAAKQCRRAVIPQVQRLCSWDQVVASIPPDALVIMPYEDEKGQSLRGTLQGEVVPREVCIIIGPEGGFDATEVDKARRLGCRPVTLGPRILRTETAGPAVLTMVLYNFGELG